MSVYDECLLSNMIQDIRVLSDAERLEKSMGYMISRIFVFIKIKL